ncbi:MAG: aspartate aminotransferase family protein [Acidimicrobiales bacterium]
MTTNAELHDRYAAVLPSFLHTLYAEPVSIERGEGGYVWDVEGKRYLDFFGGVLTTMIGHSEPTVVAAVREQAAKVMHTSTLYLSESMIAFAEDVARVSGIPDARVFFTTSGTEANDTAILLATSHRRSNQILAMRNSYHGRSFTAQAITAQRSWSSTSLTGLNVSFVQGGYRLRSPFRDLDDEAYTQACVDDLVQIIDMTTSGDVAALIAEPIQGVGGFATPPDGFFGAFSKVLDANGILFISDEVQTGWGRTGDHFWGYQAHGIVPDILTFAKGVGNGITLAGVVARAEVMDSIEVLSFSTFGGNPLSAAAGRATLARVLGDELQTNARVRGEQMSAALGPLVERTPWLAEVRGRGLMQAVEVVHADSIEPDADRAGAVMEECRDRGLLVGKGGLYGNVIRLTPMLNVTSAEIEEGMEIIDAAVAAAGD